ncbi:putative fatty acyl-CoA reductase CG5065 [Cylas formicarius]|uniref:putative fatty acyl-CoA reductase CG5065 n=1 Tax=Cylas formicarius TaxID=197179 RepID=UPI002958D0A9|nr:putative fatty acyl-CoA reductase CG5065 [Cylas formicarius]XP_060532882.1 putative fatty acyl-CoA reductase CG5065 [Cylas formicarius]XP_060532883.1 putative fatty acyl-CoA reductase CG5065 [Cylas formicarius]XP_060532885.1 putative fatty acyl-CoA reductase CG5065 [Cylas formicarius]
MRSDIKKWYAGQSVFVTGATGFMGKVLVEKLLRSCPDISTIYVLIRHKRGRDSAERLEDFLNCPVFDGIRDQPQGERILSKLQCCSGDVTYPNCNLSDQDLVLLRDNVTTVFHMAANVRFDQPLKSAVLLNVGGTLNVLDLSCTFKNLRAFVHVSTSYCHCDETDLEEKLYPAPHNPRHILEMAKWMDNELLKMLTPKLIRNYPNTYAFTKCLTEQLVSEYSIKLPIAVTRPSIVIASWKEPFPGWVDNLNGPTGILIGAGKGVIRSMHCNGNFIADVVPVDVGVNSLIIAGWKTGLEPRKNVAEVYHITADTNCALSWSEALELGRKHFYDYPFSVCLWYPGGNIKSTYFAHAVAAFFLHIVPAYLVDFLMYLTNNKTFMVRTQKRIENGLSVLQYYTTRPWHFHNEKLAKIAEELDETDREIFFTDQTKIDYNEYMKNYILGARKYCVHEEPDTLPHARKLLKRLYYLDVFKNILLIGLVLWVLYFLVTSFYDQTDGIQRSFNATVSQQHVKPVKNYVMWEA